MTDDSPLLSIIIAAFNVERYIGEAVDSALAQTYPNVEIVVVDDGSIDATAEVLSRYGDDIIRVHQENQGLPAARNAGIAAASGDLIGVLDGDDTWLPTRAQRLIDFLKEHPEFDAVTSDFFILDEDQPTTRRWYRDQYGQVFPARQDQPRRIALDNFVSIGVIMRRPMLTMIGGFDPSVRVSSDYDLWIRAILRGARVGIVDEPLAYYRVRAGSLTANGPEHWRAHLRVVERHVEAFRSTNLPVATRASYDLGREAEMHGHRRAAARWYIEALRGQPRPGWSSRAKLLVAAARALVMPSTRTAPRVDTL